MSHTKPLQWLLLSLVVVFPFVSNCLYLQFDCFHVHDLGIYHQGYVEALHQETVNPHMTTRGVRLQQDHTSLGHFVAFGFYKIFGNSPYNILLLDFLAYIFFLLVLAQHWKKGDFGKLSLPLVLLLGAINYGALSMLFHPAHPSGWSIGLMAWFYLALANDRHKQILMSGLLMVLSRESFHFCAYGLAYAYFLERDYKKMTISFVIGLLYSYFYFFLREDLAGPTLAYGSFLSQLTEGNILYNLLKISLDFDWSTLIKLSLPLLLLFWGVNARQKKALRFLWTLLPLFAIHFLTNKMRYHYAFPFSLAFLTAALVHAQHVVSPKKWATALVLFCLIPSADLYVQRVRFLVKGQSKKCAMTNNRDAGRAAIKEIIESEVKEAWLASSGGLVPHLIRPGLKIYHPSALYGLGETFQYVVLIKGNRGHNAGLSLQQLAQRESHLRALASEELYSDENYLFLKGSFAHKDILAP